MVYIPSTSLDLFVHISLHISFIVKQNQKKLYLVLIYFINIIYIHPYLFVHISLHIFAFLFLFKVLYSFDLEDTLFLDTDGPCSIGVLDTMTSPFSFRFNTIPRCSYIFSTLLPYKVIFFSGVLCSLGVLA